MKVLHQREIEAISGGMTGAYSGVPGPEVPAGGALGGGIGGMLNGVARGAAHGAARGVIGGVGGAAFGAAVGAGVAVITYTYFSRRS